MNNPPETAMAKMRELASWKGTVEPEQYHLFLRWCNNGEAFNAYIKDVVKLFPDIASAMESMHSQLQKTQELVEALEDCLSWLEERHEDAGGNANREISMAKNALQSYHSKQ